MSKIVLGKKKTDESLATIDASKLLVHTIVLGQSGSGKSFFIARLLEELLLRTKARILVIDPNGDFENFFAPRESTFWGTTKGLGKKLNDAQHLQTSAGLDGYDAKNAFAERWKDVIFQQLVSGKTDRIPLRAKAFGAPVKIHWKNIPRQIQDFLLDIDPLARPKVFQGIATCYHFTNNNQSQYAAGVSIADLEDVAMEFESRNIMASLSYYSDAMTLTSEDWHRVRMQFRMVRKRFGDMLYLKRLKNIAHSQASDLGNYIHRGFVEGDEERPPWQFLSVGLAGVPSEHGLLAAYVTLQSVWKEAIRAWREERRVAMLQVSKSALPTGKNLGEFEPVEESEVTEVEIDDTALVDDDDTEPNVKYALRRPTFVVIDEAHNYVPEEAETPLQKRVSDLVTTIAAEGRKYGLFLIISTQRPQKIRKGLVAECENLAVLKLQSVLERHHLVENTALEAGNEDKIRALNPGEVLMSGPWIGDTSVVEFAPARTFLGGSGISPEAWLS